MPICIFLKVGDILSARTGASYVSKMDLATSICFFGHTHVAGVISLSLDSQQLEATRPVELAIAERTRLLVNCGSVGKPRDGDHRAGYVVFDLNARKVSFRRIAYPIEITQDKIIDLGLPPQLAFRLSAGN